MNTEIIVAGVTKEDTAFDKRITFRYDGKEYQVLLHWDSYDGYDLNFLGKDGRTFIATPDWAVDWNEEETGEYLELHLDSLSDEVLA